MADGGEEQQQQPQQQHVPYSARPEWADVTPVDADDSSTVAAVQYTDEHRDALRYFRAVLESVSACCVCALGGGGVRVGSERERERVLARVCCAARCFAAAQSSERAHAPHTTTPQQGERSARVLALTEHLVALNAADYTAWALRYDCVIAAAAAAGVDDAAAVDAVAEAEHAFTQ